MTVLKKNTKKKSIKKDEKTKYGGYMNTPVILAITILICVGMILTTNYIVTVGNSIALKQEIVQRLDMLNAWLVEDYYQNVSKGNVQAIEENWNSAWGSSNLFDADVQEQWTQYLKEELRLYQTMNLPDQEDISNINALFDTINYRVDEYDPETNTFTYTITFTGFKIKKGVNYGKPHDSIGPEDLPDDFNYSNMTDEQYQGLSKYYAWVQSRFINLGTVKIKGSVTFNDNTLNPNQGKTNSENGGYHWQVPDVDPSDVLGGLSEDVTTPETWDRTVDLP